MLPKKLPSLVPNPQARWQSSQACSQICSSCAQSSGHVSKLSSSRSHITTTKAHTPSFAINLSTYVPYSLVVSLCIMRLWFVHAILDATHFLCYPRRGKGTLRSGELGILVCICLLVAGCVDACNNNFPIDYCRTGLVADQSCTPTQHTVRCNWEAFAHSSFSGRLCVRMENRIFSAGQVTKNAKRNFVWEFNPCPSIVHGGIYD